MIPLKTARIDYSKRVNDRKSVSVEISESIKSILDKEKVRHSLKYRVKKFDSYYNKYLDRQYKNGNESPVITDILGFRIVCPFLEELDRVEHLLSSSFNITEVEHKGDNYSFKEFGYQSVHLLVEIPIELQKKFPNTGIKVFEVQIRTILQDAWSEVEHEMVYKAEFTPYNEFLRRKLAALNANLTLSDIIFQEIRDYQRKLHVELNQRRISFTGILDTDLPDSVAEPKTVENSESDEFYNLNVVSNEDLLLKALNAHNKQEYDMARKLYDVILDRDIESNIKAIIYVHRGMAQFADGEYDKALIDFKEATEIEPENSRALYYQGTVYRVQGNYSSAINAFQMSIKIDPSYCDALFGLSQTYAKLGDFPEALKICSEALDVEPDFQKAVEYRKYLLKEMEL